MNQYTHGRVSAQARRVRHTLLQAPDLCFGKLLPREAVTAALARHGVEFRERLYTPLVTLWTFLDRKRCLTPFSRVCVGLKKVSDTILFGTLLA